MNDKALKELVTQVVMEYLGRTSPGIPVGVSNRHVHLSPEDLYACFGQGYTLRKLKDLSQTGQFAAEETVILIGPKGAIERVRILGPVRKQTQVEILQSDTYRLGIIGVLRESGDIKGTPGAVIAGPHGSVHIGEGVIVPKRHIHLEPADAERFGLRDRQEVRVSVEGGRGLVFDNVLIRVDPSFRREFHVDLDEANAGGLRSGDKVAIFPVADREQIMCG